MTGLARDPDLPMPAAVAGATREYMTRIVRPGPHPQRPARDAASLVILDETEPTPRVLMGRRHARHAFLPGVLVFPGGRVEPRDYRARPRRDVAAVTALKIAARSTARHPAALARALAMAALREAREEVGFTAFAEPPACDADLRRFAFIARAITPLKRPRRFDTRFFCVRVRGIGLLDGDTDGELEDVGWYALNALAKEDLHVVSRAVIETLIDRMNAGRFDDPQAPVPLFFARGSSFQRVLL